MPRPRSGGASLVIRRSGRASAECGADHLGERLLLRAVGCEADQLTGARVEGRLTRSHEHVVATGVAEVPENPRLDDPGRAWWALDGEVVDLAQAVARVQVVVGDGLGDDGGACAVGSGGEGHDPGERLVWG